LFNNKKLRITSELNGSIVAVKNEARKRPIYQILQSIPCVNIYIFKYIRFFSNFQIKSKSPANNICVSRNCSGLYFFL